MKTQTSAVPSVALAALLVFPGCPSPPRSEVPAPTADSAAAASSLPSDTPRLILWLVVDQMRADYLERFRPLLRHGLARLLEESTVFTDAHHDHATTSTAPGHATLATGCHPARHGIVGNYWFDRGLRKEIYSARDDDNDERTPERLLASTFGAWLKAASPGSKVLTASGKDRAAVLTAGREADAAFWFDDDDGEFVTAPYYGELERPWVKAFHREQHCDGWFGEVWEPLPEVAEHAGEYGVEALDEGLFQSRFPRRLGYARLAPDEAYYASIYRSPYLDAYLGRFAQAMILGEKLGEDDGTPDFLGVSFSALDTVGHGFGPDSPELLDTLLRLDRVLGELLDFVDREIGLENVVVTLSSDHGIPPIPELLRSRGGDALRFAGAETACIQRAARALREELGEGDWILEGFYVDRELADARGVDMSKIEDVIRRHAESCPRVARVLSRSDLESAPPDDRYARLYRHSYHPERSPDVFVELEPHTLAVGSSRTNHGSPHPYDTAVPWLLRLPEGRGLRIDERVHTVDVAPTLAGVIGLEITGSVDGIDRSEWFRYDGVKR